MATYAQALAILTEARTSIRDEILTAQARGQLGAVPAIARKIERLNICIDGPGSAVSGPSVVPPVGTSTTLLGQGTMTLGGFTATISAVGADLSLTFSEPTTGFVTEESMPVSNSGDYWVSFGAVSNGLIISDSAYTTTANWTNFGTFQVNTSNQANILAVGVSGTFRIHVTSKDATIISVMERVA